MADTKINSTTANFTIPKISGNNISKDIVIRLADPNKYDVYQKDLPAKLPAGYDWINNFGIKERHRDPNSLTVTIPSRESDPYALNVDTYTIELDDIAGKEPVYYHNSQVQNFPAQKTVLKNGRIQLTLGLGDPPDRLAKSKLNEKTHSDMLPEWVFSCGNPPMTSTGNAWTIKWNYQLAQPARQSKSRD